ncbi:bifunctional metallophosphatase/5'-nucleotidase [Holophaga foetida]|uniref:bifunctional metallophosphatase/5'-nucleotidase n=1 Tax=Holophaga foetida TaxID=35839 RepID=UPI00024721AA|nr:metallophosphoesterase [Holophaga foetida]
MVDRRAFLGGLGAAFLASRLPLRAESSPRITLLHTNDTHSHLEPLASGSLAGRGGIARRAALVKRLRSQGGNLLLLDAGDVFQGTPYFNRFKGSLDYKLMSMAGYDAGTLGNHDFDAGIEGLMTALEEATFPILNCNFTWEGAPRLGQKILPWTVKTFPGLKVGLTGVGVEFHGLVFPKNHEGVGWRDPVAPLGAVVRRLREVEKVDLLVVLSHLGLDHHGAAIDDLNLARLVPGIDVIIGGHTHTFMDTPVRVDDTHIFQVGYAGVNLGRMDFALGPKGEAIACGSASLPLVDRRG